MDGEIPFLLRPPRLRLQGRPQAAGLGDAMAAAQAAAAAPSPASGHYFLLRDGASSAPLRRETAAGMLERGMRRPTDLACAPGDIVWRPLRAVFPGVRPRPGPAADDPEESPALSALLGPGEWLWDALGYPFRGGGFFLLGAGAFLIAASRSGFGMSPASPTASSVIPLVVFFLWFFGLLRAVIWTTGVGRNTALRFTAVWNLFGGSAGNDGPDGGGVAGIRDLGLWVGCTLACFLPGGVTLAAARATGAEFLAGFSVALLAAGCWFWPMSLFIAALTGSTACLSPARLTSVMRQTRGSYASLVVLTLGLTAAMVTELASPGGPGANGFGVLRAALDCSYLAMVLARAMGLFFRRHKADLGFRQL